MPLASSACKTSDTLRFKLQDGPLSKLQENQHNKTQSIHKYPDTSAIKFAIDSLGSINPTATRQPNARAFIQLATLASRCLNMCKDPAVPSLKPPDSDFPTFNVHLLNYTLLFCIRCRHCFCLSFAPSSAQA